MKVLINFSTLKKGGGQNVALNFLNIFLNENYPHDVFFVCAEGTIIERLLLDHYTREKVLSLSPNPVRRIWEELTKGARFCKRNSIDIIYSYFGFGLFPKSIPQVMGSADSNLFFPDINFWSQYKGYKLLGKKIIDKYRVYGLKRCDGIVLETELLEMRCHEIYKVKAFTRTIKPSINIAFGNEFFKIPNATTNRKALLLCGWQLNKNIMLIPDVAAYLKSLRFEYQFVITAPIDGSQIQQDFFNKVRSLNVDSYINVIGGVDKKYLESLYKQVDVIILLSKLESFSNNIIEAWTYKRVLLVANEPWAKYICKEGAYYVDRDNVSQIGNSLIELASNNVKYAEIVKRGEEMLKTYPSIEEKTKQELEFIEYVYNEKKH